MVPQECLTQKPARELRSVPTGGFKFGHVLDPADYLGCLDEMLKDMKETVWSKRDGGKTWGLDENVYVGGGIDNYIQCLELAASELNLQLT